MLCRLFVFCFWSIKKAIYLSNPSKQFASVRQKNGYLNLNETGADEKRRIYLEIKHSCLNMWFY